MVPFLVPNPGAIGCQTSLRTGGAGGRFFSWSLQVRREGAEGMGHGAKGKGHGAKGMGHGAKGMEQRVKGMSMVQKGW